MLKSALLVSAICLAFIVPASAATTAKCDEASLTAMRAQIDAMTDKEKQKTVMGNWEAANAAFKANNIDDCTARVADASKGLDDTGAGANEGPDNSGANAPANNNSDANGDASSNSN